MIWISADKRVLLALSVLAFVSLSAAQIGGQGYFQDGSSGSITGADTGFSIPQYDSQSELITQLVAPFLFVSFLMRLALMRALRLALARDDDDRVAFFYGREERIDVSSEATIMSVAITAMLIPTAAWDYIILLGQLMGVIPQVLVLGFLLYVGYLVFS